MKKHWLTILILILLACGAMAQDRQLTQEQRIIAMTILGEARGEGEAGMYAVGCIIAQRSIAWGKTPRQVCLKKWQFSCWNPNDPNKAKLPSLLNTPQGAYAKRLAVNLKQLQRSYINNADHYCTLSSNPFWSYKTVIKNGKKINGTNAEESTSWQVNNMIDTLFHAERKEQYAASISQSYQVNEPWLPSHWLERRKQ